MYNVWMNNKYLLFSDLHLGIHNSSEVWLEASVRFFTEIINKCKEENITKILFLGDFFNDRRSINLKTIWTSIELANIIEEAEIDLYLILGNHDLYLKNSLQPHSLKMFNKYKYIHVIDSITELNEYITLVPWSLSWKKVETPYICGHLEINGFDIESGDNEFENNVSDFKRYTKVYSGHFHNPRTIRNIEYIGSCMPFTFHDVDSQRGYYVLDIINDKKYTEEFVPFTKSPQYKIIYSNQPLKEEDIKGNVVKLVYMNELSNIADEELIAKITALNPVLLQPDFKSIVSEEEKVESEDKDISTLKNAVTLLFEYTDKVTPPEHIKTELVKQFIKQLITSKEE